METKRRTAKKERKKERKKEGKKKEREKEKEKEKRRGNPNYITCIQDQNQMGFGGLNKVRKK
jgi:hypothetical protein